MAQSKEATLFINCRAMRSSPKPNCLLAIAYWLKMSLVLSAGAITVAPSVIQAQAPRSPTPASMKGVVEVQTIAKGLEHPWSLAFLPEKRMLVSERPGRLRVVAPDGRISEPLAGVPQVYASGQGGLLDVVLSPMFDK